MSTGRTLQHWAGLARVLMLLILAAPGLPAFGEVCDVDSDGDIDRLDLEAIFAARNQPASGADDPRDEDANGFITVLDGRACALRCALAQCVITEPQEPPVLEEIPPLQVAEAASLSVEISATDEEGDSLEFSADALPAFASLTPGAGNSAILQLEPGYTDAGEYSFEVSVSDGKAVDSQTVTLTVVNSNRLPELVVALSHSVRENEQLTITANATDADNEALTYTAAGLPAFGAFRDNRDGTATIVLSPGFESAGSYTVTLTVTDASDGSTSADVAVTVTNVNRPPVILSQPVLSATEGDRYSYQAIAEDPDNDTLQFTLNLAPLGMQVGESAGLITWIPGRTQVGQHAVSVTVSDGQGGEAVQGFQVEVSAGPDRESPYVELVVPEEVVAGGILEVVAVAEDDIAVEKVSFYIDDLLAGEVTVAPYRIDFNAPDQTGPPVHVRAVATDTAGNSAEDEATVTVVQDDDVTPPVIESVTAPPSAAAGEDVSIRIEASDERGIEAIRIELDGAVVATLTTPPYETILAIPATAATGSELVYVITAADAAGNTATAEARITVDDAPDSTPPGPVTVQAPATGVPGQFVAVTASAVDDTGILKVVFLADGVPFHEADTPPYAAALPVPADQPVGSQITVTATATDFSGNATTSAPAVVLMVEAGAALLSGEVFDDASGLPLPGAVVRARPLADASADPLGSTVSNDRGRFSMELLEGPVVIEVQRGGYTRVSRRTILQPGVVNTVPDFRLTPLAPPVGVDPRVDTRLALALLNVEVTIPAGALASLAEMHVTPVGGQGLRALLPPGWSPVGAFHLGPESLEFTSPVRVSLAALAENIIVARWDKALHAWVRLSLADLPEGKALDLDAPGSVVLLKPDTSPQAPPMQAAGGVLGGVNPTPVPADASAGLSPSPDILFMQPGARSEVEIELRNASPLPSGTTLSVEFTESYRRTDGTVLIPPVTRQDIVLYQTAAGLSGRFTASPSEVFDPALLTQGVIHLEALGGGDGIGRVLVGSGGGSVTTPDGITLILPPGALGGGTATVQAVGAAGSEEPTGNTAVSLARLPDLPAGFVDPADFELLAGVEIELGTEPLLLPAILQLPPDAALPAGARVLAARAVRVNDASRLQLVGLGTVNDTGVEIVAGNLGLALPGIDRSGRYYLFQANIALGYITGTIEGSAITPGQVIAETAAAPFVSLVQGDADPYVLVLPPGAQQVQATDLDNGRNGAGSATVDAAGDIVTLDLQLGEARPTVEQVIPADGATGVVTTASITVRFSREMDAATIDDTTFKLESVSGAVNGTAALLPDGLSAAFLPDSLLSDSTQYQVVIDPDVRDVFGGALLGNQQDGSYRASFETLDRTPPPRPEAGQLTASYIDPDTLRIAGTQGSGEPGTLVTATNLTTGAAVTVIVQVDGSFSLDINITPADQLELFFSDAGGNRMELGIARPVVLTGFSVSPEAIVLLETGSERTITARATYSDGSVVDVDTAAMTLQSSDTQVADVNADGIVTAVGEGDAVITITFGEEPFRQVANMPVQVAVDGNVLIQAEMGPGGGVLEADNGVRIEIPPGALSETVNMTVEEIQLDAPLMVDVFGSPQPVVGLYRFSPDLTFDVPVEISMPISDSVLAGLGEDDDLLVLSDNSPALEQLLPDDLSEFDEDGEFNNQYFDRLNKVVKVGVSHFSYRVIMVVPPDDVDDSTAGTLDNPDGSSVDIRILHSERAGQCWRGRTPTYRAIGNKSSDKNVVLHASNGSTKVNFRLTFPAGWVRRPVEIKTVDGGRFIWVGANPGNNPPTVKTYNVSRSSTLAFNIGTFRPDFSIKIGGVHISEQQHDYTVQKILDGDITRSTVSLTDAAGNAFNVTVTATVKSTSNQNSILTKSRGKCKTGQYAVKSDGSVYELFEAKKRSDHASGRNSLSTGIEIYHSGQSAELYAGPQIDGLLALTDSLLNRSGQDILSDDRARRRKPLEFATTYLSPKVDQRPTSNSGDTEPVITHREVDRDYNRDPAGHACGTSFRKSDPCKPFPLEAVVAGLSYDFPGLIDTSGGDTRKAVGSPPGKGGNVSIRYGILSGELDISRFKGIPGGTIADLVEIIEIPEGVSKKLAGLDGTVSSGTKDDIGDLIIRGDLVLDANSTLRVSGTLYLAPTGRILSENNAGGSPVNGVNLTIYAAGPVILHGHVDLSGTDVISSQPGNGGNLVVDSRARSPLLIPTIVTQGGDVMLYDENQGVESGKGGQGGNVTIRGAPEGLIVLSGIKTMPSPVIACDYNMAYTGDAGLRYPINMLPQYRVSNGEVWKYESRYFDSTVLCSVLGEYQPRFGLARTMGRGIVTSGGMGASARRGVVLFDERVDGAPGGDSGDIDIGFPSGEAGTVRFRGVSLISGSGTGMIKTRIPVALLYQEPPTFDLPYLQVTGGAGGKGGTDETVNIVGDNYLAKVGGLGGKGGKAGNITIDPAATIFPSPQSSCSSSVELPGHDLGIPKENPITTNGHIATICGQVTSGSGESATVHDLDMLTLVLRKTGSNEYRTVGGSGGLAGGGLSNISSSEKDFRTNGTGGIFGARGEDGGLSVPDALLSVIRQTVTVELPP